MEMKPLGSTGISVPEIGLGTWKYKGDPNIIAKSLELGANLIDTAEMYYTEDSVGRAIRAQREEYFVATKVSPSNLKYSDVIQAAEQSLKRLETGHIDLYQIHFPNEDIPIGETMQAMRDLVEDGKVRFVGVSNFSIAQLEEAQQALRNYPIVSNQVLYNLFDRQIEAELLPYCEANKVTVIAYSPLAQGKLDQELKQRPHLAQVMDTLCSELDKTRAQILLNWCIYHPWVMTIPATNRVMGVVENCAASGWRLTPEQYALLSEAAD